MEIFSQPSQFQLPVYLQQVMKNDSIYLNKQHKCIFIEEMEPDICKDGWYDVKVFVLTFPYISRIWNCQNLHFYSIQ